MYKNRQLTTVLTLYRSCTSKIPCTMYMLYAIYMYVYMKRNGNHVQKMYDHVPMYSKRSAGSRRCTALYKMYSTLYQRYHTTQPMYNTCTPSASIQQ